ncbi:unnamed protein product [Ranitomeya imitator]|uniref:Chromo domain-containing protein n=1 Tax=Ranitomeya imitator TaxID=111125 RepID=A0ABN9MDK3_9NEOB|nr:unnamed protein product [Ranitomeya imitator]
MVPSVEPPAPVLVEGELEYIVEKILDSRVSRRKLQYLVKWKGYAQEDNSWVFASDVHAPDLVRAFHHLAKNLHKQLVLFYNELDGSPILKNRESRIHIYFMYSNVNPHREVFWTHVKSDACRFALMWKYGGIYMDTDVISIRRIPEDNFLAAETFSTTSSSVFGLSSYHTLTWEFMENFVQNYRGSKWGHQGPGVFTRVVNKHCGVPKFIYIDHTKCANVSYFHPERFYPILYPSWKRYFEVWSKLPTFKNSFALHLWNYMNDEKETMVPRTNTLVEHLYQQYCPSTYDAILNSKATYV